MNIDILKAYVREGLLGFTCVVSMWSCSPAVNQFSSWYKHVVLRVCFGSICKVNFKSNKLHNLLCRSIFTLFTFSSFVIMAKSDAVRLFITPYLLYCFTQCIECEFICLNTFYFSLWSFLALADLCLVVFPSIWIFLRCCVNKTRPKRTVNPSGKSGSVLHFVPAKIFCQTLVLSYLLHIVISC